MHDNKCDTTASPAATDVSLPSALGITIVLSPNGIAKTETAQINTVDGIFKKVEIPRNSKGIIISLTIQSKYIFIFVNVSFNEINDIAIPVKSIAIGDIQFAETEMIDSIQLGIGTLINPTIIPTIIEINIGLRNDLIFSLNVFPLSESYSKSLGTPHK